MTKRAYPFTEESLWATTKKRKTTNTYNEHFFYY